jgi:hypothetical protein
MALLKGIGKQLQVGFARETTRGTASTTGVLWMAVDDWEMEERYANAVDSQVYGVIEDSVSQTRVKNWAEGQVKFPIAGTTSAVLFYSLFGTDTRGTHSGESSIYDHVLTVAQHVQHQSLTMHVHDPIATASGTTADYTHANTVVHKIDIDYSLGNFVMGTATLKGQAGSAAAVVFVPSQTIEDRFVRQYLTFKVASALSGLDAASAIKIKSAKITLDAGDEDDDVLGQVAPRDFLNKEFMCEGTIEAIWQNESDFKAAALANTAKAMRLHLVNSDVNIGVVPSHPEFKLDFAKVYFTEFSRPIAIKDVVYQTVKFKAAYSVSDALMVRATFTNSVTTY